MMNVLDCPDLFPVPPTDDQAPDAPNWLSSLETNDNGKPRPVIANAIHALTLSLEWRGVLAFNAFDGSIVKLREPPMRSNERPAEYAIGEWNDTDTSLAAAWLSRHADVHLNPKLVGRAVYTVAQQKRFHPVREYLSALKWDGRVRLPGWLATYFGSEQNPYTEAIGTMWLISAVARVYSPGCKVDHAIVLEGPQGAGKSSALEVLAGMPWFSDTPVIFGEKDSYEALRGVWIYELAELSALRRSDVEAQKAYISKRHDRYRRPYGEGPIQWPRQVVFAGTTNDSKYLIDPTGNRRFWPVACGTISTEALKTDRDQLWAEAVVRYEQGEKWHIESPELMRMASEIQGARVQEDSWETLVGRWLDTEKAKYLIDQGHGLSLADVASVALSIRAENLDKAVTTRVGIIMRKFGWTERRCVTIPGTQNREWRLFTS